MNRANSRTALRVAIVVGYALTIISMAFSDAFNNSLPIEYQQYLARLMSEPTSRATEISLLFGAPFFIGSFIAPIGLYFFKKWAVILYIVCGIGLMVTAIGFEPFMYHYILSIINIMGSMIVGFTLAIIFFTDAIYGESSEIDRQINEGQG